MAVPSRQPKDRRTDRGKRLYEDMMSNPEWLQRAEEGHQAIREGRTITLQELKKDLGDV